MGANAPVLLALSLIPFTNNFINPVKDNVFFYLMMTEYIMRGYILCSVNDAPFVGNVLLILS